MGGIGEQPTITYDVRGGQTIDSIAARMVALAKETGERVRAMFSGILELTATPESTVEDVIGDWRTRMDQAVEARDRSPEGQRAARAKERLIEEAQKQVDALMEQLPHLDFTNPEAVLDWLCELLGPSEFSAVVKSPEVILTRFAEHGYVPDMNAREEFNAEDRDNVAGFIIGQALAGVRDLNGAIERIVHDWTEQWKSDFPS